MYLNICASIIFKHSGYGLCGVQNGQKSDSIYAIRINELKRFFTRHGSPVTSALRPYCVNDKMKNKIYCGFFELACYTL